MKILYLIPARGGSKGIPGKNIKPLAGRPLIFYTIEAARKVAADEDICVSTDSEEIKRMVEKDGLKVPFIRPNKLSTDEASSEDVMMHAVNFYASVGRHYDVLVLLQPTSPIRTAQHLEEALKHFSNDVDMVVSGCETKANPYYVLFEEDENGLLHKSKEAAFTRRQDCPKVFEINGAIYIINVDSLRVKGIKNFGIIKKYEMDRLSSIDIDDETDWFLAEQILKRVSPHG
jgi:CMP-N,N'-diacetyllegionaminic acid synthase